MTEQVLEAVLANQEALHPFDPAGIIGDSAKLRLKEREVALTERRVVLLEKKAAQADAAEGIVKDGDLNEAEKAQRLRSLFGMG